MVNNAPGIYKTGTATVEAGGLLVAFQGVPDLRAQIRPGDTFGAHVGLNIIIDGVEANAVVLADPWPGAAQTEAPYKIAFTPYDLGYREDTQNIIQRYGRGALPALAELTGIRDAVPVFTGPSTMGLLTRQELTLGARYDAQVATLAARAAYDNRAEGFAVLVSNVGDGRAAIYSREGVAGNWSAPAYITGNSITLDVTEVDEVPFGVPPDVTMTARAGGYDLAFDIPRGMIIQPGTTTTLPPDQPAAVNFVPITGGYRLDISLPRGATGNIDGVTPFWVSRLGSDTSASAAQAGLELVKQASADDMTAGRLLTVGAFGMGRPIPIIGIDCNSTSLVTATYYSGTSPVNGPPGAGAGWLDHISHPSDSNFATQQWRDLASNTRWERTKLSGVWPIWAQIFDSQHRFVSSAQPVFSASRPGTHQTSAGVISWAAPRVNQGGHFNTGTNVFTCPVAGRYLVSFHNLVYQNIVPSGGTQVFIRQNGANMIQSYQDSGYSSAGGSYNAGSAMGILNCSANDTIDFNLVYGMAYNGSACNGSIALLN